MEEPSPDSPEKASAKEGNGGQQPAPAPVPAEPPRLSVLGVTSLLFGMAGVLTLALLFHGLFGISTFLFLFLGLAPVVTQLVLGLLQMLTFALPVIGLVPAIVALICGHLALVKIKHSRKRLRGRLPAITGLISGYVTIFLALILVVALLVAYPHIDKFFRKNQETARLDQASTLYFACEQFARDHEDGYPKTWEDLGGRYVNPRHLDLLLAGHHGRSWMRLKNRIGSGSEPESDPQPESFELVPHERPVLRELEGTVVVIREMAPPDVPRVVIVYDNGRTTMTANPNRE